MLVRLTTRVLTRIQHHAWSLRLRLEPIDERGGGRNTDEGFHISAGAVIAGVIAAGVAAFVADKLGALK
ncbi:hypothetical protein EV383_2434 [Pseudonocardia sediminis]|uniref:Uncharacterized protein n=1 Tax=Pseudonocardia sediminis TaxID=1397368 RepID=A0A4Q7UXA3_PSEST|nr:hypothetical protein [Pseudonocardia sediminis]RZT85561.1 hypothetical protein EV383_2434 [Pseudonocardia sediminis]